MPKAKAPQNILLPSQVKSLPSGVKETIDAWDADEASRILRLLPPKKELPDPKAYMAWATEDKAKQQTTKQRAHQARDGFTSLSARLQSEGVHIPCSSYPRYTRHLLEYLQSSNIPLPVGGEAMHLLLEDSNPPACWCHECSRLTDQERIRLHSTWLLPVTLLYKGGNNTVLHMDARMGGPHPENVDCLLETLAKHLRSKQCYADYADLAIFMGSNIIEYGQVPTVTIDALWHQYCQENKQAEIPKQQRSLQLELRKLQNPAIIQKSEVLLMVGCRNSWEETLAHLLHDREDDGYYSVFTNAGLLLKRHQDNPARLLHAPEWDDFPLQVVGPLKKNEEPTAHLNVNFKSTAGKAPSKLESTIPFHS